MPEGTLQCEVCGRSLAPSEAVEAVKPIVTPSYGRFPNRVIDGEHVMVHEHCFAIARGNYR